MTTPIEKVRAACDRMREAREKVLDAHAVLISVEDGDEVEPDEAAARDAVALAHQLLRAALLKRGAP